MLLNCFSFNCNLFKHFLKNIFVLLNSFVHSHVTLMVFLKQFPFEDNKVLFYYLLLDVVCTHAYVAMKGCNGTVKKRCRFSGKD